MLKLIILCSYKDIQLYKRDTKNLVFSIDRTNASGCVSFNYLAPSLELLELVKSGCSIDNYHELFRVELLSYEKQIGLSLIEDLSNQSFEIILCSADVDAKNSHRIDVYDALIARGMECELY